MSNLQENTDSFYVYISNEYNKGKPVKFRIENNDDWINGTNEWKRAKELYDAAKGRLEKARNFLIRNCKDDNAYGNGIAVEKIVSKGRINYKIIPELQGLDLDKYRGSELESYRIGEIYPENEEEINWE